MTTATGHYAAVAERIRERLQPFCERIEIAGGIRRGKPDPHDIEIVAVPRLEVYTATVDMFSTEQRTHNLLDQELARWRTERRLSDRPDKHGRAAWGERFKRVQFHDGDDVIPLDIFSVLPPAQWGVIFAIRTGPAEFGHKLVTSRLDGGAKPVGVEIKEGSITLNGSRVDVPEEDDYFRLLGVPTWPPEQRSLARLTGFLRGGQ